jgi:DNA mismatch repair protein MutL
VIGTVGSRFAVLETEDGMVLMDPRAARERILFERARRELETNQVASQPLLVPATIDCDPLQSRTVRRHLETFRKLGFALEPFGGDTFLVEALPAWMDDVDPGETLKTLAEELDRAGGKAGTPEKCRDQLARSCCRIAAGVRSMPSERELGLIMHELGRCAMPYTTPYGRPTLIHMGLGELRRKFGLE